MNKISMLLALTISTPILAVEVQEINVQDLSEKIRKNGVLRDAIISTEVVDSTDLENKQALNLSEAIQDENGVESREGCSICGMRRVRINGLKGEHTTVLVDGVPLNSTVSSFYGFDALGTSGIDRIEISRGAGASSIAPEAIGGVVNIIRKKATKDSTSMNFALGDFGYKLFSGTSTKVSEDKSFGTTFTAQYSDQDQRDDDGNGVNEAPSIETYMVGLKHFHDLSEKDNLVIDATSLKSSTFGGAMNETIFSPTAASGGLSFEDNDVRKSYIGNPKEVTEIVDIQRNELTLTYTRLIDDMSNFVVKQSLAKQIQDSWYEGSDYYHENTTHFNDFQYNKQVNEKHFITAGLDYKREILNSKSQAFFVSGNKDKDDYDYNSYGLYLRDIWTLSKNIELSSGVRVNKITTDWTDKKAEDNEIDTSIIAPRVHLRWNHSKTTTSRIAAGVGYRAPLTFFESEHGILDDGFDVDISELEKSQTFSYSLGIEEKRYLFNFGASTTKLENLAYIDDSLATPTLKNYNDDLTVSSFDMTYGYQLTTPLSVGITYEKFLYEDDYKANLSLAAIEERVKLDFEYEEDDFMINLYVNWVGARDLEPYGYSDRYNKTGKSSKKSTYAQAYSTTDIKGSYNLDKALKVYVGVNNLFDYTQEESPLFFDGSDEFDVTHIYGPLKGRQVYLGLQSSF